jgi:hypothetical protein
MKYKQIHGKKTIFTEVLASRNSLNLPRSSNDINCGGKIR